MLYVEPGPEGVRVRRLPIDEPHGDDVTQGSLDRPLDHEPQGDTRPPRPFLHAYGNPGSLTAERLATLAPLIDVLLAHDRPDDVEALWVYVISVFDPQSPLHAMIMKSISAPAKEMYMTLEEELLTRGQKLGEARGQKLGEARGQKLGEARGRARGKAEAVLGVLEHRKVPVSASLRKRILAMQDELALQRFFERAFVVSTAAELLEPAPRRSTARARATATSPPRGPTRAHSTYCDQKSSVG